MCAASGLWIGDIWAFCRQLAAPQDGPREHNSFSFFDTEAATTTCLETHHFPDGFEFPDPEEWYPGPPSHPQSVTATST